MHIKSRDQNISKINRKKRLGQYFTEEKLSKLLSAFSVYPEYNLIIDPMCGKADMLVAANTFNEKADLYGIDIDAIAINAAKKNFETVNKSNELHHLFHANALSTDIVRKLPFLQFDLVITNPPYVRYQTLSNNSDNQDLPTAEEVRKSLLEFVQEMVHLDIEDKRIFTEIVKGYSGLSDLAVPSWILCCLFTKIGGRLAMVVPEAWLKRDYSYSIQYLLLKYFELEYVIEDVDRCWFKEAQVKTNLIIAKRRTRVSNLITHYQGKQYVHIALRKEHGDEISLVSHLVSPVDNKELTFKKEIKQNLEKYVSMKICQIVETSDTLENVLVNAKKYNWFKNIEGNYTSVNKGIENINIFPTTLKRMLEVSSSGFVSLENMGVSIGQGLRTGANKFFYVDYVREDEEYTVVKVDKIFNKDTIELPTILLEPVLRKQAELPLGFALDSSEVSGRVLILDKVIHPGDFHAIKEISISRKIMNKDLSDFIDEVSVKNIGSETDPKYIPYLSAVKTNKTKMKSHDPNTVRYWYMLPELADRHKPLIFVPRIINQTPKFFLNTDPPTVIDANFSSIWITNEAKIDQYGLIALLNSSWFLLVCELIGSVMGGGALKLEATHLKKAPLPHLSEIEYNQLSLLGRKLLEGELGTLAIIDQLIAKSISPDNTNLLLKAIEELTFWKRNVRIKTSKE